MGKSKLPAAQPSTGGAPSIYSEDLADRICELLSQGMGLREICRRDDMPGTSTVIRWLFDEDKKYFWVQYARAREVQAELMADELNEIADESSNDWMERNDPDNAGYLINGECMARTRLRLDTRKWLMSKLLPKKYGDKLVVDSTSKVEVTQRTTEELPLGEIRDKSEEVERRLDS